MQSDSTGAALGAESMRLLRGQIHKTQEAISETALMSRPRGVYGNGPEGLRDKIGVTTSERRRLQRGSLTMGR